jgi:hypothetical protein
MTRLKLPSIELQTLAFVEAAMLRQRTVFASLEWNGFRVRLGYSPRIKFANECVLADVLLILSAEVPVRYQRRGWFTRYCQLCAMLSGGALLVHNAKLPELIHSLERHGFEQEKKDIWTFFKRSDSLWPFPLEH